MVTIGDLNVKLSLGADKFVSGLRSASRRVTNFTSGIGQSTRTVLKWGGALTALVGGGGGLYLVHKALTGIDALSKFSDEVGLSNERLAGLQLGAKLAGSDVDTLKVGIEKLAQNLGLLNAGYKSLTIDLGLKAIGLSAKDLKGLNVDQSLHKIADAMQATADPAARAAAATQLFGRGGKSLINLLSQGGNAINGFTDEAKRLGIAFDREAGAKVEMFNDSMTRLEALVSGVTRQLTIQFIPILTAMSDKLIALGESGDGIGKKMVSFAKTSVSGMARIADWVALLKAAFESFNYVMGELASGAAHAFALIIDALNDVYAALHFGGKSEALTQWSKDLNATADAIDWAAQQQKKAAGLNFNVWMNQTNSHEALAAIDKIQADADKTAKAIADAHRNTAGLAEGANDGAEAMKKMAAESKKISDAVGRAQEILAGEKKNSDLDLINKGLDVVTKRIKDMRANPLFMFGGADTKDFKTLQDQQSKLLAAQSKVQADQAKKDLEASPLYRFAQNVKEKLQSPMDKFAAGVAQLKQAVARGLIKPEQARAYGKTLLADLQGSIGQLRNRLGQAPELALSGSAQSQLQVLRARFQTNATDQQIPRQQLQLAQRQLDTLDDIRTALNDSATSKVEIPPA